MIDKKSLKRISAITGVPQATIEKDLALSVALARLSESGLSDDLVFKGGTAIRKIYFEKARFSEDLDFNVKKGIGKEKIVSVLKTIFLGTISGINFSSMDEEKTSTGLKANLKFTGPLEYPQRIRLDFNFRENTLKNPEKRKLIDSYGIGDWQVNVMSLDEIFAEKIHALSSRAAPRDLYDVWFLMENNVRLDKDLVEGKLSYYNEKFDKKLIESNIGDIEKGWQPDLQRLLGKLPEFGVVASKVKKELF